MSKPITWHRMNIGYFRTKCGRGEIRRRHFDDQRKGRTVWLIYVEDHFIRGYDLKKDAMRAVESRIYDLDQMYESLSEEFRDV